MLSVEPLVLSMQKTNFNRSNIDYLNQQESKRFNRLLSQKKKEKIKKYYQYCSYLDTSTEEVSFSKYQELAEQELNQNKRMIKKNRGKN